MIEIKLNNLVCSTHKRQKENFSVARHRKTQMKTSHFSENFDLCHPQLGSERANINLTTNSDFSSDIPSKHVSITSFGTSVAGNYLTSSTSSSSQANASTYGSGSNEQQPSKYEKNANELLIKRQQRQHQQQQEQNKKRKRETDDYQHDEHIKFFTDATTVINNGCTFEWL